MGIPPIASAGRAPSPTESTTAAARADTAPRRNAAAPEFDAVTRQPLPLRFPWLSRLAHRLEAASAQRPPFAAAPLIGERLDRKA